jgi:hypothetical protein
MRIFNKETKPEEVKAEVVKEEAMPQKEMKLDETDVIVLIKFHSEQIAYLTSLLVH